MVMSVEFYRNAVQCHQLPQVDLFALIYFVQVPLYIYHSRLDVFAIQRKLNKGNFLELFLKLKKFPKFIHLGVKQPEYLQMFGKM